MSHIDHNFDTVFKRRAVGAIQGAFKYSNVQHRKEGYFHMNVSLQRLSAIFLIGIALC